MKKWNVKWQETRVVNCFADLVAANTAEEAIALAQAYEVEEVIERESHTVEMHAATAREEVEEIKKDHIHNFDRREAGPYLHCKVPGCDAKERDE